MFFLFEYKLPFSNVSMEAIYNELAGALEPKSPTLCVGLQEAHVLVLRRGCNYKRVKAPMLVVKSHAPLRALVPQTPAHELPAWVYTLQACLSCEAAVVGGGINSHQPRQHTRSHPRVTS